MVNYSYSRTQKGLIHWGCCAASILCAAAAFAVTADSVWQWGLFSIAALSAAMGLCLASLTVTDKGKELSIAFGPLPFIRRRIAYAKVADVTVARTDGGDSWGVQYIPGHDTTYNIHGSDCVELHLRNSTACIRVGTDDAEGLASMIRNRIRQ